MTVQRDERGQARRDGWRWPRNCWRLWRLHCLVHPSQCPYAGVAKVPDRPRFSLSARFHQPFSAGLRADPFCFDLSAPKGRESGHRRRRRDRHAEREALLLCHYFGVQGRVYQRQLDGTTDLEASSPAARLLQSAQLLMPFQLISSPLSLQFRPKVRGIRFRRHRLLLRLLDLAASRRSFAFTRRRWRRPRP